MILTGVFRKIRNSSLMLVTLSILLFLVAVLVGINYAQYRAEKEYRADIDKQVVQIIHNIENIFDEANRLANKVTTMWGRPCIKSEYELKKLVATSNIARSATILYNDSVYCSSVYKLGTDDLDYSTFNKNIILAHNKLNPDSSIVGYRLVNDKWAVLIGINAKLFAGLLEAYKYNQNIFLDIQDQLLADSAQIFKLDELKDKDKILSFNSSKYPFKIMVKIDNPSFLDYYLPYLVFFLLLALLGLFQTIFIALTASRRDIKRAIIANEFIPYYQLVVTSSNYKWHGMEVLMRWQHPKRGLLQPGKFIPLAERSGLIVPMTRQMMIKVANDLIPYVNVLPKPFFIGININAEYLYEPTLLLDCKNFQAKFSDQRINLVLEITEGQLVESSEALDNLFDEFRQIGVQISIDDFGTGYSNFAYLQKLKVDHIKIDKTFVGMICTTADAQYLVDAIIRLAKKLKIALVAEGVETYEQLQYLTDQKVDYIQGFLFSRPAPIEEMLKTLVQPTNIVRSFQQFTMFNEFN